MESMLNCGYFDGVILGGPAESIARNIAKIVMIKAKMAQLELLKM